MATWMSDHCLLRVKPSTFKGEMVSRLDLESRSFVSLTLLLPGTQKLTHKVLFFSEQLQELVAASGLTGDLVRHWFCKQASLSRTEKAAAAQVAAPRPVVPGEAVEPTATGSSPLEPQAGRGTEEKMEQSICGVAPRVLEANTDRIANLAKGISK